MEFNFDKSKINTLENDYSLFHPSIEQMVILYQMAKFLASEIGLTEKQCRNLLIGSYIGVQQSKQIFHYEIENEIVPIRLKYAEEVYLQIEANLIDILHENADRKELSNNLKQLFDVYFEKFGTR